VGIFLDYGFEYYVRLYSQPVIPPESPCIVKSCRVNQNTHFMFNFFPPENRSAYEIMCKNIVEPDRAQMTMWRMRIPCWILKATNTNPEYVILIAFPRQLWLHERASMLHCTYIACPVLIFTNT
jgi:hypothetical protein